MLKERILSASILLLDFFSSYLSKNPTYFLLLSFLCKGFYFYELAKILKLKSLSLVVYWILSFSPIIFFYFIYIGINFFLMTNQDLFKKLFKRFSILISFIGQFSGFLLVPLDILYKKISSNSKFKIFLWIFYFYSYGLSNFIYVY